MINWRSAFKSTVVIQQTQWDGTWSQLDHDSFTAKRVHVKNSSLDIHNCSHACIYLYGDVRLYYSDWEHVRGYTLLLYLTCIFPSMWLMVMGSNPEEGPEVTSALWIQSDSGKAPQVSDSCSPQSNTRKSRHICCLWILTLPADTSGFLGFLWFSVQILEAWRGE